MSVNSNQPPEMVRKQQALNASKNEAQRVSDRLQDKLSLLKGHEDKADSRFKERESIENRFANNRYQDARENQENRNDQNIQSKVMHNNWIINNQVLKDKMNSTEKKSAKSNSNNKSVIIVKPNLDERTSLRKISGSERKRTDRDEIMNDPKFFKNEVMGKENVPVQKVRSNSAK